MAIFNNTVVTKKGHALIAKGVAGKQISFTNIRTSDHAYSSDTNFENLTILGSIKQSVTISAVTVENESTVRVKSVVINTDLITGYFLKNIGLYATDPDEGEILFSVTSATTADFIPAYTGVNVSKINIDLLTTVSNSENVNLTVSPGGLVTTDMLSTETEPGLVTLTDVQQEILKSYTQNLNIPGYMKLSNGLTIQWLNAQYDQATSASGTTVSFPMAFNNACLAIFAMDRAGGCNSMGAAIINRFQGRIWAMQINGAIYATTNVVIMAIGY